MANAINWFEIPASDFDRAVAFYSEILGAPLQVGEMMGVQMGMLPYEQGKEIGGAICAGEGYVPSENGPKVYLNGGDDLSNVLRRVDGAGGKVVMPKTKISDEIGFFGIFMDTEGNQIFLHSQQ